jgi:nicotinamide-nucleotide amidase
MQAEVIAIGDELTSGQRLDTNSQWLSQRLGELGIRVLYHTTVGDDQDANVRVFREAFDRADLVVCTGGLGPTADDLTRQAIAEATGKELVLDEASLQHIQQLFARRQRPMPERNIIQAKFPAGSRVVPNPHGSAPGIDLDVRRGGASCRVFALPGVPAEMREMWDQTVDPILQTLTGGRRVIRHYRIKCFGIGESDLEQMLPDLIERGRQPSVGITVSKATITLRVTSEGENEEACLRAMEPTIATIHSCLGDLVFGEEEDELQHVVVRLLQERGATVCTTEFGPGGLLSDWLSQVDPQGEVFLGGTVIRRAASVTALTQLRNAEQISAEKLVAAMASHNRESFESDYSLAIGPFPASDSSASVPGSLHFALASSSGIIAKSSPFAGHPDILRPRAVKQALDLLRLELAKNSSQNSQVS